MDRLPLLTHPHDDSVIAWRGGAPVTRRRFLAHARAVAEGFPAGTHILNACSDRYHFALTLAAGMMTGRINLMPSTYTPEAVRHMAAFAPDAFVVSEGNDALAAALPHSPFPDLAGIDTHDAPPVPALPPEQAIAWVFTSGSTGTPVPHLKTWGKLVANTRAAARQLGLAERAQGAFSLLGTVPPQHMYGFESTILLALQGGGAFGADRAFFPSEIAAQLAALPRPRLLVTTPHHLRTVLRADEAMPPADLLLSATAPLDEDLAGAAEAAFGGPLLEIYGSTETGQIATRRTAAGEPWQLFPDIRLEDRDAATWALGGHIEQPVPLGDRIELTGPGRFRLVGRNADLINIAGKRSSLAYLDRQLQAIDGVEDGAFHLPDESGREITRLAAFVVAPGLTAAQIVAALRTRIDPLFLPRPLVLLDRLPRNATGKLPRDVRARLLAETPGPEESDTP
ncbi:AMP-binding protein [Nitrogeniibacter mangrovi]|uniref:AMP-binding protein n=1 Tax=Nitrogeniibacter mangrovi TaxID=2016596 RepID=UPI001C2D9391|nr:AMP-binding protein [Nitrogeniibacter mangrovi]